MSRDGSKTKSAPIILSLILVLIMLVSVICIIAGRSGSDTVVTIYSCGEELWSGRLDEITGEKIFTVVASPDGGHPVLIEGADSSHEHYNIVKVTPEGVSVTDSDCKNRICIHQGETGSGGLPIACLPNRLLITVTSGEGDGADAYTY